MKKILKLFVGACLATCALTANAQTGVGNYDIVTGNGPVEVKPSTIGPDGPGDNSVVVYSDGSQGGISQPFSSDAPYVRVTADVYLQYGNALLTLTDSGGATSVIGGTDVPDQWVTLSQVIPNPGPSVIQVLSGDQAGSAFAVHSVTVEPVYDEDVSMWTGPTSYAPPTIPSYTPPADLYAPAQPLEQIVPQYSDISSTVAALRDLSSLYDTANNFGSGTPMTYDGGYIPSADMWP